MTNVSTTVKRCSWGPLVSGIILLICLVVATIYLTTGKIRQSSFSLNSDEIIHLRVIQEMHDCGDSCLSSFWTPTHGGQPYFQKPPFKMWLSQIPLYLFGQSNLSYRLIDSAIGIGIVCLTVSLGLSLYSSFHLGAIAALLLLSVKPFVLEEHGFRRATQDGMLVLLVTASLLILWRWLIADKRCKSKTDFSYPLLFGLTTGLAVMTKSYAGFLPLIVAAAVAGQLLLLRLFKMGPVSQLQTHVQVKLPTIKQVSLAILVSLTIPACFFLPHYFSADGKMRQALSSEIAMRAIAGFHRSEGPWLYLQRIFSDDLLSSSIVVVAAVVYALLLLLRSKTTDGTRLSTWFLLTAVATPLLLFTSFPSRLIWYIFPALPPLALLVAKLVVDTARFLPKHWQALRQHDKHSARISGGVLLCLSLGFFGLLLLEAYDDFKQVSRAIEAEPRERLEIDKLQEVILADLKTSGAEILVLGNPLNLSANPKAGVFNVEALYWRFFERFASSGLDLQQITAKLKANFNGFVIGDFKQISTLFETRTPDYYFELQPFHIRKQALFVAAYGENLLKHHPQLFRPWKQLIDFGARKFGPAEFSIDKLQILYGFDPPEATEGLTVAFNQGARSALLLTGNQLLSERGSEQLLNIGYNQPYSTEALTLKIYLNETLVADIDLQRNALTSYQFSIPAQTWSPGLNELKFVPQYKTKHFPESDRVLMYNWLTIRPVTH